MPPKQLESHENHFLDVIGRLPVQSQRRRTGARPLRSICIQKQYKHAHPEAIAGKGANVVSLGDMTVRDIRTSLLVLFGAVVCVLIIACVNVANLLLAQALGRQREVAIRAAVGASRGSNSSGQLLTESVLLAILGRGPQVLPWRRSPPAYLATKAPPMPRYLPQVEQHCGGLPGVPVHLRNRVASRGSPPGFFPAAQASRFDLASNLKDSGRSSTPGRSHARFRDILVSAEVALSLMVLLLPAGLQLRSF